MSQLTSDPNARKVILLGFNTILVLTVGIRVHVTIVARWVAIRSAAGRARRANLEIMAGLEIWGRRWKNGKKRVESKDKV